MDQALYDRIQELQHASLFRAGDDDASTRVVDSPFLGSPIATAFERIMSYDDPTVEIGRMGVHEVHFACLGFDAVRDGLEHLSKIRSWTTDGAINVRRMAGGRC